MALVVSAAFPVSNDGPKVAEKRRRLDQFNKIQLQCAEAFVSEAQALAEGCWRADTEEPSPAGLAVLVSRGRQAPSPTSRADLWTMRAPPGRSQRWLAWSPGAWRRLQG